MRLQFWKPDQEDPTTRNLWYLCVEVFWSSLIYAVSTFNIAFAVRLGATNTQIGMMSSAAALIAVIISIPAGHFLHSRAYRKPWILGGLAAYRSGYLLIVLLPLLGGMGASVGWLAVIIMSLLTIPDTFANLGFTDALPDLVPLPKRTSIFAARNMIFSGTLGLSTFLFGLWLNRMDFPLNYQVMYLFGILISMVGLYFVSHIQMPRYEIQQDPGTGLHLPRGAAVRSGWKAFTRFISSNPGFTRLTINTTLLNFGLWMVGPLYIPYYINTMGASDAWIGLNNAVYFFATLAGYALATRVVSRWETMSILKHTSLLQGTYPLLVGIFPALTPTLLIGCGYGILASVFSLNHFNVLLGQVPEARRPQSIAAYTTVVNLAAFLCPILGVALSNQIGLRLAMVVCGMLSIAGALPFWFYPIPDKEAAASV